jgi:hypothetical protein
MNRRDFLLTTTAATLGGAIFTTNSARAAEERKISFKGRYDLTADVVIIGAGLGGCSAALAALRRGLKVILTEETDWIGGQLTQQAVPPDEHRWIETHGANQSYRDLRNAIRDYYRRHYPLTEAAKAKADLNPGDGTVSRLCHEPRVALAVLESWFAPWQSSGQLTLLLEHKASAAEVAADAVVAVEVKNQRYGNKVVLSAPYFIDATELGDLLPLTKTEYVTGAEAKADTGELHAAEKADPENQQAFTMCFALEYVAGRESVIEKPREYEYWRNFTPKLMPMWSGRLLDLHYTHPRTMLPKKLGFNPEGEHPGTITNLWKYRRIASKANFQPGAYPGDICLVNWPQNDYLLGNLVDVPETAFRMHVDRAKQLSLSLVYWLQTEVERPDGKQGWPGLRLRKDITGTFSGLAKYPYVRESRRIKSMFTVKEQHVGLTMRAKALGVMESEVKAEEFFDSVGVGSYAIDLHPTSKGDNYIDFLTAPFQIPLGALLPQRMKNLLPANKNIGTTHLTNGCYRLHPVEWGVGEAVGSLVSYCTQKKLPPQAVREKREVLADFQREIVARGVEIAWR